MKTILTDKDSGLTSATNERDQLSLELNELKAKFKALDDEHFDLLR